MSESLPLMLDAEMLNITSAEYDLINEKLGRKPNQLELEVFSVLWSEHASYKNSKSKLSTLPTSGSHILVKAGEDNAGAVDLGNGYACVAKLESYNQPCSIQPRLGAFTGVRILNRDIIAMGAKPLAYLNSIRFGDDERDTARWLFNEVVNGLCDFEKAINVPFVGGEVFFNEGYNSSPVVNNLAVGIVPIKKIVPATAKGDGNVVAIMGALTGVDGMDDDTFVADFLLNNGAKKLTLEHLEDIRVEKLLMEAVELLNDRDILIGLQSIGDQGIVGAVSEMLAKGDSGAVLDYQKVPYREVPLSIREALLSKTWGRMLICLKAEDLEAAGELVKALGISFAPLATVNSSGRLTCNDGDESLINIPVKSVGWYSEFNMPEKEVKKRERKHNIVDLDTLSEPDHYPTTVRKMMDSLNIVSKKCLSEAFQKPFINEAVSNRFPSDASYVEFDDSDLALTLTVDGDPVYVEADPRIGTQIAVAEAARNIVCAGGQPLAVLDCMNFGDPSDPEVYSDFSEAIGGLKIACEFFKTPVIGGNVSFYNKRSSGTALKGIVPSPVIGMVGVLKDKNKHTTLSFKHKGDMIFLIGKSRNDLNCSEYVERIHGITNTPPPRFNLGEELELHRIISGIIENGLARSVHDVSNGGLFFALLESAIPLQFGFDITSDAEIRKDAFLFGESQSRAIISVAPSKQDEFIDFMLHKGISFSALGHVTKSEIRIDDESYGFIADLEKKFASCLTNWTQAEKV